MRSPFSAQKSKFIGIWTFILLFVVKDTFVKPAYAQLNTTIALVDAPVQTPVLAGAGSTLDACALNPACVAALGSELVPAIAAPTAAGVSNTSVTVTAGANGLQTAVKVAAGIAVVAKVLSPQPTGQDDLNWHYWGQPQNQSAQERAKQRYCEAYPTDIVCPKQLTGVPYRITGDINYERPTTVGIDNYWHTIFKPWTRHIDSINNSGSYQPRGPVHAVYVRLTPHPEYGKTANSGTVNPQPAENYDWQLIVSWGNPANVQTWGNGGDWTRPGEPPKLINLKVFPLNGEQEPPGLPWKDWPQQKRSIAVAALKEPDWQELIKSMPEGGRLIPGDRLDAPVIALPGLPLDDPNTSVDERLTRKLPGPWTVPYPDLIPNPSPSPSPSPSPNPSPNPSPSPSPSPTPPPPTNNTDPSPAPSTPPPDNDKPGKEATGEGAFATEETLPYYPPDKVVGQLQPDSCVAAACRMAIYDSTGDDYPETWLREAAKVEPNEGTLLQNAVDALDQYGVTSRYESNLSVETLEATTKDRSAIVTVKTLTTGGEHALIVDGVEDGYTLIRDPLPAGQGTAYKVKTETFTNAWTGKAVIIKP